MTQLRNILAGTRPQPNTSSPDTTGLINGDGNNVYGSWSGSATSSAFYMPNGIADNADYPQANGVAPLYTYTDPQGNVHPLVVCSSPAYAGRWGEVSSVPGVPFTNPANPSSTPSNLVQTNYANPIRAGYSFDVTDLITSLNNNGL